MRAAGGGNLHSSPNESIWTRRQEGGWRWWIREDWAAAWDAPGAPVWHDLESDPRAECVKANDGRAVYRASWQDRLVFVKCARPPRRWAKFQRWLLGSSARREQRAGQYANKYGIATVDIIACGEAPIRGRECCSLLVTAGVPDAVPLNLYWRGLDDQASSPRRARNQLIDRVARLIAEAHQKGFHHLDLHAGNILIQPQGEDGVRAVFVDLQNVRVGRAVSLRAVLGNLAQINQWFSMHATLTDRWRFLRRYLHWRRHEVAGSYSRSLNLDARAILPWLAKAIRRHSDRLYAKRDRIAMRTGRYFARLKLDRRWRAHVYLSTKHPVDGSIASRLEMTIEEWKSHLSDPPAWLNPSDRRMILKASGASRVCRAVLRTTSGAEVDLVCKSRIPKTWFKKLLQPFRTSPSMRTWKRANALINRRILTARPLAVVERRWFGLLREDLGLTEHIGNAQDLDTVLTVAMRSMSLQEQRRLKSQLIDVILQTLRALTSRGFVHRDFKAVNLLVQQDPDGRERPRIVLVDLDGLRRSRPSGAARGAKRMMTRLNVSLDHCRRVSRTDRLRFLLRYLQHTRRSERDWKTLWRALENDSRLKRECRRAHQQKKLEKYGRF